MFFYAVEKNIELFGNKTKTLYLCIRFRIVINTTLK